MSKPANIHVKRESPYNATSPLANIEAFLSSFVVASFLQHTHLLCHLPRRRVGALLTHINGASRSTPTQHRRHVKMRKQIFTNVSGWARERRKNFISFSFPRRRHRLCRRRTLSSFNIYFCTYQNEREKCASKVLFLGLSFSFFFFIFAMHMRHDWWLQATKAPIDDERWSGRF